MKTLMIVLGLALAGPSLAGVIDTAQKAEAAANEAWSAWGGEIGVRWNRDLLAIYGVAVEDGVERTATTDKRRHEWFALRESGGLRFLVRNGALQRFSDGSLRMRGGYVVRLADGSRIDLRDLTLRVRAGDPRILDLVGADGKAWFYTDRVMFELVDDRKVLAIACKEEPLAHGDHVFATADWKSLYRGIELSQRLNPPDVVTLSQDRRTVQVVFYAGASTDDIRVILEDP